MVGKVSLALVGNLPSDDINTGWQSVNYLHHTSGMKINYLSMGGAKECKTSSEGLSPDRCFPVEINPNGKTRRRLTQKATNFEMNWQEEFKREKDKVD